MEKESREFLYDLLNTPSPTGFEQKIQKKVRGRMERYADSIDSDLHGNLYISLNPKAEKKVMLAGHCDQIGFMVTHISPEGFISVSPLGGIDVGVMPGALVTIYASKGPITGVVGRKPIHQQEPDERKSLKLDIEKMWVDVGGKSRKEIEKIVEIGDPVTYKLGVTEMMNGLISAPGLDDRVGLFVAMEALKLCRDSKLSVGLVGVSTVQEEVGLRGATTSAFRIQPEVGIAIDVTHASDSPVTEKKNVPPCVLGKGPTICRGPNVNPVVEKMLVAAAKKKRIPYQPAPSSRLLGNDANAIQIAGPGVAAASIGIPNRYMHTQVEVCHLSDIENAAKLLAVFVNGIKPKTDFRP